MDLYKIKYPKQTRYCSKFYLCDLANRLFTHPMPNHDNAAITLPIIDLLHSYQLNIIPKEQYDINYLLNMNNNSIKEFATFLLLSIQDNIRDRIIRILRMLYLINLILITKINIFNVIIIKIIIILRFFSIM